MGLRHIPATLGSPRDSVGEFQQRLEGQRRIEVLIHGLNERLTQRSVFQPLALPVGGGQRLAVALQLPLRDLELLEIMGPFLAVVIARQVKSESVRRPGLEQVANHHQISQRFAHLLAFIRHHRGMQPVPDERTNPGDRLNLGDFTFMVRKDQIRASGVNIDRLSQKSRDQRGAFDVPTGSAGSPGALPGRLPRGLGLPEYEVQRVPLVGVFGMIPTLVGDRQHLLARDAAEFPIFRPSLNVEVDAAASLICDTGPEQVLNALDDLNHCVAGARQVVRGPHVQGEHVFDEVRGPPIAQQAPVLTDLGRLAQDIVVDVSYVLDVDDLVAAVLKIADEHICARVGEGVPKVSGIVRGDAAYIERDCLAGGLERLEAAGETVVKLQHRTSSMTKVLR